MTDLIYGITEDIYILGNERRVSYGIAAYSNYKTDSTATIVASVRDVSSNRSLIEKLIYSCNRLSLSPDHLLDVVFDFIDE